MNENEKEKGLLLLSGGYDSAVLLARECREGRKPGCLTFDYGQRHAARELFAADCLAHEYRLWPHYAVVRLPKGLLSGSSLTGDGDVPKGLHFADPGQASTVVPNRNLMLLSIAASYAARYGYGRVLIAAHQGDAGIYPDCRPEFIEAADRAMTLACGVGVAAPFLGMTKRDIADLGRSLGVRAELTWTCYEGGERPCGECGACIERAEAFA
jgi:7-cyano-7-deazaguanine synthase